MSVIRLFINWYQPTDLARVRENEFALLKNLLNPDIDRIYALSACSLPKWAYKCPKLRIYPVDRRPTFSDFYSAMMFYNSNTKINIIANTDIYYDSSIRTTHNLTSGEVIALSRWERVQRQWILHKAQQLSKDSQDSWIFKGIPKVLETLKFCLGDLGCDNSLAWHFNQSYQVINPALTIKSYHVHSSGIRYYDRRFPARKVSPPYHLVPADRW